LIALFVLPLALCDVPIDMNALYLVWGAPNDFFFITDRSRAPGTNSAAVTNLVTITAKLQSLGATQIIVAGMPGPQPHTVCAVTRRSRARNGPLMQDVTMGFNSTRRISFLLASASSTPIPCS
jgi:phospholipase/lecithinase/hemolysin